MSKAEAIRSISAMSAGTIAAIVKSDKYSIIDKALNQWVLTAQDMQEDAFKNCANCWDVVNLVNMEG